VEASQSASAVLEGRALKFGDNISTDFITPGRYMHLRGNIAELAKHAMEDADPTFVQRVRPGDLVVAGKNLGMGSSREFAPLVLKLNGVAAIVAKSCARIFFRNSINQGLPVLICDTDRISEGDQLHADLKRGVLVNRTTGEEIAIGELPPVMLRILSEGGVKPFIQQHGSFRTLGEAEPEAGQAKDTAPRTLAEKILGEKAGKPVKAGDIVIIDVDLAFGHDASGPLAFREMEGMGLAKVAHPERTAAFLDHSVPSPRAELSREQQFLREMAWKNDVPVFDVGTGICHQIILEQFAVPGGVTIGTDSHTCTSGAMCDFGTGMGASDVAVALGTGQAWFRVPETIQVRLNGRMNKGVYAKDVVLELERRLGVDGATYKALEFIGELVPELTISERATFSNMAVEMGGKVGLFPSDEQTRTWMADYGRAEKWRPMQPDSGATYEATIDIDCSTLEPMVALPHQPDNVRPVSEVKGTPIHQIFIGTCTNARLDDLAVAARMLKGRRVHSHTRLLVVPASQGVMLEAMKRGYLQDLLEAGATIGIPSCAACFGMHMGVPADGENALSTQSRNFQGRMGNTEAFIYLSSPAVAAATAITGVITDPREVM